MTQADLTALVLSWLTVQRPLASALRLSRAQKALLGSELVAVAMLVALTPPAPRLPRAWKAALRSGPVAAQVAPPVPALWLPPRALMGLPRSGLVAVAVLAALAALAWLTARQPLAPAAPMAVTVSPMEMRPPGCALAPAGPTVLGPLIAVP